jgi:hypothetical protein
MTSMTYNSLVAEITSYLNRLDAQTLANIPNFISQAEQRICREVETIGIESYVVGTFFPSNPVYPKPGRWRRTLAINFGSGPTFSKRNPIYERSYDYIRNYWPDDTVTNAPQFYADYGYSNWLFAPTPDQAYPFEISYLELPEQLTINNQTNWITDYAPDVLLYASLLEAMPYLKNDERIPVWQAFYERGVNSLKTQNHSRLLDRQSNIQSDKGPASSQQGGG